MNSSFNIVDVIKSIKKNFRLIVMITVASAVIGAIFHFVSPKRYEAKTEFILRNPLYGDRNNLYNYDTKFIDYFAGEDDLNRIIMLSSSGIVQNEVIERTNLSEAYKLDKNNPKEKVKLIKKFDKNLNIMRSEYRHLILTYNDTNPLLAANVANETVVVLEQTFSDFYSEMRKNMYLSIIKKVTEEDSSIASLTDTLALLREKYGIYDIVSPSRHNLVSSSIKENSHKDFGRGLELVQNIESLKDELVADRAVKTTLSNQYKTSNYKNAFPLIKVITPALPPVTTKGLGGLVTVIISACLGLLFCTLIILIRDSIKYISEIN